MFGKLIKNEFRNTWKMMGMINGALVVMHLIMMLFTEVLQDRIPFSNFLNITYNIYGFTYIISLFAIQFGVFIFFSTRYFKKIYSDQGYLTHTLPVKKSLVTGAMVISSSFWSIVTFLITFSYPSAKATYELNLFFGGTKDIAILYQRLMEEGFTFYTFASFALTGVFAVVCYYVLMFLSISVGQNWKKHPMLGTLLTFWIAHTVLQVGGFSLLIHLVESEVISREWIRWVGETAGRTFNTVSTIGNILAVILITIGLTVNNFIMRKRLNL